MMRKNKKETRKHANVGVSGGYLKARTMSGYDPSDDYMGQKLELEHLKEQKKISRKKHRNIAILCSLAVLGLMTFAFSQITIILNGVEYNDSTISKERSDDYLDAAAQYLTKHPSERFNWSSKSESLSIHLQESYPEIASAQIRGGFGTGELYIEIRQPVAVWKTAADSNFVDKNGVIFQENYYKDPSVVIDDRSGSGVISQRFLQFIGKIIAGVESSGIGQVEKVVIPANSIRSVEITLSGRNYFVKIQTDREAQSQVTDIVDMLKYLDENNIKPNNYVDVRVKNRGFWV